MSLFSAHWYRAEGLRPQLKRHCVIGRQVHRGRVWHVVSNRATAEHFRVTQPAYHLIGLMDGRRTVGEIWRAAAEGLGEALPSQDEVVDLLARLHQSDLLNVGAAPDVAELADRRRTRARRMALQKVKNPFAIRVPLLDPDRFLTRTAPYVAPFFSWVGLAALTALLLWGGALTALHWPELTGNLTDRVLAFENVLLMAAIYPVMKAAHELGHAYAIKRWGGEVHEIGVMMLFLMPVPYVDASAAAAWPSKWRRALVSGMGVFMELALSAIAMIIWVSVEPGAVRAVAFAAMVTGGISTLLFNGNPLLRFDGYYMLSDLVEIPNLAGRGNQFVGYLVKRYAFGLRHARFPALARGEAAWLAVYAVAAYCYRLFIAFAIALLVSGWFFALGALFALLAVWQMVVAPMAKALREVMMGEGLAPVRRRAVAVTSAGAMILLALFLFAPLPYASLERAVTTRSADSEIAAATAGVVVETFAAAGDIVAAGQLLARLENPALAAQRTAAALEIAALQASLDAERARSPAATERAREQLGRAAAALERLDAQLAGLEIRAPKAGRLAWRDTRALSGQRLSKGRSIGWVIDESEPITLLVAVAEADADLARARREAVWVRFPHLPGREYPAEFVREAPAVRDALPSAALSTEGGGDFDLDPAAPPSAPGAPLPVLQGVVLFEARLLENPPNGWEGATARVKIDHGWASAAVQIARPLRQILLRSLQF